MDETRGAAVPSRFTVTAEIVAAITSSLVLEEVLASVAERIAGAFDVWECGIYEYHAADGLAVAQALWTRAPHLGDEGWVGSAPTPAEQPVLYQVLRERRAIETTIDDPELPAGERAAMEWWDEKSCLYVPLLSREQVIGCLELVEKREVRRFTEAEFQLAGTLAALAAVTIENARLYGRVERLAITDGLTGLFNHRYFYDRLTQEVARATRYGLPLSLLMLDLDNFKGFNDRYGHRAGDALLRDLGALLVAQTREKVDLVARYGGEEFAIILPSTGADGATRAGVRLCDAVQEGAVEQQLAAPIEQQLAAPSPPADGERGDGGEQDDGGENAALVVGERIRHGVETESFGSGARPPVVTVSVGVASLGKHATTVDDLVELADRSMYKAKARGKNRVEVAET